MNKLSFFKSNPTISFENPILNPMNWQFKIQILFKSKILSVMFC